MTQKVFIQVVVFMTIITFSGGILLTGGELQWQWLRFASGAVFIGTIAIAAWDRFLWKVQPVQRLSTVPRDISGTWAGTLKSPWVDPATGKVVAPKVAYLVIRQRATLVSATLLTDEQRSTSDLAKVVPGHDQELVYMYLSKPRNDLQVRSRIHHGSTSLRISGSPSTGLSGHYWTDRDSGGQLDFDQRRPKTYADNFDTAAAMFDKTPNAGSKHHRRSR